MRATTSLCADSGSAYDDVLSVGKIREDIPWVRARCAEGASRVYRNPARVAAQYGRRDIDRLRPAVDTPLAVQERIVVALGGIAWRVHVAPKHPAVLERASREHGALSTPILPNETPHVAQAMPGEKHPEGALAKEQVAPAGRRTRVRERRQRGWSERRPQRIQLREPSGDVA